MNLIQRLKIWKELKRLEQKARMSPSPSTFIDLGQVYINLEMHEQTLELAEEGLALFPQSQELRKLRRFAKKNQLAARISTTKSSIERDPHPDRYQELASLHLELGDFDAVQGACEECIRRFPQDPGAHLLLGRAWLTNFYRDLRAREGAQAVGHLEQALENGADFEDVRRLLAEFYWRIGADAQCREQLAALRGANAVDDEMEALEQAVGRQPTQAVADIEALLHETETRGRLPRAPVHARSFEGTPQSSGRSFTERSTPSAPTSVGGVRDALARIADRPGVRKATYIRGSKALVKGQIKDGRDSFLRVVRVVARSAQRAARRMDIGNFNKGVVEGSFGRICVCSFGEALAAVECSSEVDTAPILIELQELVAGSLVQSRFDTEGV